MAEVFVDTSGWACLFVPEERFHAEARAVMDERLSAVETREQELEASTNARHEPFLALLFLLLTLFF